MAKINPTDGSRRHDSGHAAAVADKERYVSDVTAGNNGNDRSYTPRESAESDAHGGSFFDIYKPAQGYYTRIWSGVMAGSLVCWMAYFLYEKLGIVGTGSTTRYIQFGTATAVIIVFGLLAYWLLALNRKICDFLIATEGEMKKVNWTTRKEIIGSTKVVIFVVISMTVFVFMFDIFFMLFFSSIGILKGEGMFDAIKRIF
jgi:preprotein translocase subunit SecE